MVYGSNDFFHTDRDRYKQLDILTLLYADDVVVMCDNSADLKFFIETFENLTQKYGLSMNVKKTCTMSLIQFQEDSARRIIKNQQVNTTNKNISIRNQMIENVEEFSYLGYHVTKDQTIEKEIETRTTKAARAFNMLRHIIWSRKTISIQAKLRIFRACAMPVLVYGSEVWTLTMAQERRLMAFYHRCLRTIVGVNIDDRMSNDQLLKLTGQPFHNEILRRNRLRWFGHVNRSVSNDREPLIMKKVMFRYYPNAKRPRNHGIRKRWEDKVLDDIAKARNSKLATINRRSKTMVTIDQQQDTLSTSIIKYYSCATTIKTTSKTKKTSYKYKNKSFTMQSNRGDISQCRWYVYVSGM